MGKFYSSEEYRRFIFSKNFKDGYAEKLLDEFAGLAIDNPKLTEVNRVEEFTVIPVPSDVSTGIFMNLVRWLTQENSMIFYGIAVHDTDGYFVIPDTMNKWGDTVLIGFDDGTAGRLEIPIGLFDENSAFSPMHENIFEYFEGSEYIEEKYENCNDFLNHKCTPLLFDYIYDDIFISGGVSAEKISFIEKNLNIELEAEYKSFLMKYGMIMGYGVEILGCGKNGTFPILEETLRYRKMGLENDYIVIRNADEWVYCLNVKTGAVSSWDKIDRHHIIKADSFNEYVLEELEESDEDDDE